MVPRLRLSPPRPKRRGRRSGKFERNRVRLFALLRERSPCRSTDEELAKIMSCSATQIQRYLRVLREEKAVDVAVSHLMLGPGQWRNSRVIWVRAREE